MELCRCATPDELRSLTAHPSPIVRGYAFWALSSNGGSDLLPILLQHIGDTAAVDVQFGCVVHHPRVGDFLIDVVNGRYGKGEAGLGPAQRAQLDSVLLFTPNNLEARSDLLLEVGPEPALYPRIRELTRTEQDPCALVALAKYHKEEDVPLILDQYVRDLSEEGREVVHPLEAIQEFPHPAFRTTLERHLRSSLDEGLHAREWSHLYQAIAQYKDRWALGLLNLPFGAAPKPSTREFRLDYLLDALWSVDAPLYDTLLWKLWSEEDRIDRDVLDRLSSRDPERAYRTMKLDVAEASRFRQGMHGSFRSSIPSDSLLAIMLERVLERDSAFGVAMIVKHIQDTDVLNFEVFAQAAGRIQDSSFVALLLGRARKESNPYYLLKAAEALLAYQDPAINRRLLAVMAEKRDLNEAWAGKELFVLLRRKGIE
ncbi:MAG TPA: hypothetical protein VGE21_01195 [Flavobacteriales bacterium]